MSTTKLPPEASVDTPANSPGPVDVFMVWSAVKAKSEMIFILVLVSIIAAIGLTYIISERYVAGTVLELKIPESGSGNDKIVGFLGSNKPYTAIGRAKAELVHDKAVAVYVVKKLHLEKQKKKRSWFKQFRSQVKKSILDAYTFSKYGYIKKLSDFDGAVFSVIKSIDAELVKSTYLIRLEARAPDPYTASAIANTAAEGFIKHRRKVIKKELQIILTAREKAVDARELALNEAATKLEDYKKEHDIVSYSDEVAGRVQENIQLEIAKTQIKARTWTINKTIDENQEKLDSARSTERELTELMRKVDEAKQAHEMALTNYQATKLAYEDRLDEVSVVQKAEPPLYPSRPIKILYAGLGAFLGLLLGTGYAIVSAAVQQRKPLDILPPDPDGNS